MNLPITSIVRNANGSWTFTWTSTGASSYRVILWANLLKTVTTNSYTTALGGFVNQPPPLEVVVAGDTAISEKYLPYLTMQWYGEPCQYYQVEQSPDMGVTWSPLSRLQEVGLWIYTFQTVILTDEVTYNYRVVAIDAYGNRSTPRLYNRYVVTPPAPPSVVISYAPTQITVSAS